MQSLVCLTRYITFHVRDTNKDCCYFLIKLQQAKTRYFKLEWLLKYFCLFHSLRLPNRHKICTFSNVKKQGLVNLILKSKYSYRLFPMVKGQRIHKMLSKVFKTILHVITYLLTFVPYFQVKWEQ